MTGTVVVLGSKPDAPLPDIPAKIAIVANTAVMLGAEYKKRYGTYVIAMSPYRQLAGYEYVQDAYKANPPDEVVILAGSQSDAEQLIHDKMGLKQVPVSVLSEYERQWSLLRQFGWHRFVLMVRIFFKVVTVRESLYCLYSFIRNPKDDRHLRWLVRSTGINAILYGLQRFPKQRDLIVAGVGLEGGGHFNGEGHFKQTSARLDNIFMRCVPKQIFNKLFTTDEVLSSRGGLKLWEGDTFQFDLEAAKK